MKGVITLAYLTSKKVNGKRYFYVAKYTGKQLYYSSTYKYRYIFSFGNQQVAFERLTLWLLDNRFIPEELIEMGISIDELKHWHERIEQTINQCS